MRLLGHGKVYKKGGALSARGAKLRRKRVGKREREEPRFCLEKERMTYLI